MGFISSISGRESSEVVALDISSARVKLLALSGTPGSYRIEAYANEHLPANAMEDQVIAEPEVLAQAITRAMRRASCRHKQAAVAVSGSSVISKIIDMPVGLSEDEIEEQIAFEADAYIPYPIDEVSLDFQVLGPSERDDQMQAVLLAACRRDTVETRVNAVERAGLKAKVVDIQAYAVQNACGLLTQQLPDGGQGRTLAVVNLGGSGMAVNVLHDGETVYTREQAFGGQVLLEEIQRHYELNSSEEALARLRAGNLDAEISEQALPRFAEQAAQQIERSLQFFFSASAQHERVDEVLLVGGCALHPQIDRQISEYLDIPTKIANPLAGMRAVQSARRNRVESEGPALMVASGLALRAFD